MVPSLLVGSSTEAVSQEDFMEVMYLVTKMGKIIKSIINCECAICLHVVTKKLYTYPFSLK